MLTPDEWSVDYGVTVLDPDGWRVDGKAWNEPIPEAEFWWRMNQSTVRAWAYPGAGL